MKNKVKLAALAAATIASMVVYKLVFDANERKKKPKEPAPPPAP